MSRSLGRDDDRKEQANETSGSVEDLGLSRAGDSELRSRADVAGEDPEYGDNRRERVIVRDREYRIRPSERVLLRELGVFRVVRESDLVAGAFRGDRKLAEADFRSLRKQKLIKSITFQRLTSEPCRVHMLSGTGHELVLAENDGRAQFYYFGAVKPAEVEHDSLLYRAYLKEDQRIRSRGGTVRRVVLDTELKREHFKRTIKPGVAYRKFQAESAKELHLPVIDGHVVFPDFRIEYEDERGEMGRVDVEVATGNYREQHLQTKSAAGFRVYSMSGVSVQSGHPLKGQVFPRENRVLLSL